MERIALTARGVERAYGVSRDRVAAAVQAGDLRGARIGRRTYTILRRDVEDWLERHRVAPAHPAQRVAEDLEQEARRA